jgi:hypothetical protein
MNRTLYAVVPSGVASSVAGSTHLPDGLPSVCGIVTVGSMFTKDLGTYADVSTMYVRARCLLRSRL